MAPTVLSKDNGPFPSRTHLTVETPNTGLPHDTVELGLLWTLATYIADLSFSIIRYETRLVWRNRTTALCSVCVCVCVCACV